MALTLPSSNGNIVFFENNSASDQVQINSHFNGGLTKTTSTLTPTRLKNIEEQFLEQSTLPPKPFLHDHMAGFVPPTVNIKLNVRPQANISIDNNFNLDLSIGQSQNSKQSFEYFSSNSNSNDSYTNHFSDGYSSETNSSVNGGKNYSFSNFTTDSNSSSCVKMRGNSGRNNNQAKNRSKSTGANTAICSTRSSPRSSQSSKKSTGGGRKPNSSQNLTPEEDLKRQKRRERNKLAAARCRKKRVDQTNFLMEQTKELRKKHNSLIKEIKVLLKEFQTCKNVLESHESECCNLKIRFPPEMYSQIDIAAINAAMEPVVDDDLDNDLNATCYASSSQEEFPQAPPPKRKRPNSLTFRPMIPNKLLEQNNNQVSNNMTGGISLNDSSHSNSNMFSTPSNGLFDFALMESTGLTPLNPTLTHVNLTPSTMNSFLKTLASPMEDGERKLLSM